MHAVLVRFRICRLSSNVRVTGEPLRRSEHGWLDSLIQVDAAQLGTIAGSGGLRYLGKQQGLRELAGTIVGRCTTAVVAPLQSASNSLSSRGETRRPHPRLIVDGGVSERVAWTRSAHATVSIVVGVGELVSLG